MQFASLVRQALHLRAAGAGSADAAPRLDVYTAIHKALRLFMGDTLARLGRVDVDDADDLVPVLGQVDELLSELRHHVRNEDNFVHTAIEARRPGGAARTRGDHAEHLAEIATLAATTHALRMSEAADRPALALRLYRELAAFVAENLRHMQFEESQNNAALWALYSDTELVALHDRILHSLPPQEVLLVARWMARALSPQELLAVCVDMRSKMPPEPFLTVLELIRDQLDTARRLKLSRALGMAPVLRSPDGQAVDLERGAVPA